MNRLVDLWRRWRNTSRTRRAPWTHLGVQDLEERCLPSSPRHLQLGALPAPPTVLAGDFNGDGKLDVARLSATGIWQVGLSEGRAFSLNPWGNWGARANWRAFVVGDFNGDGKDDIAGLNARGHWIVGISTGSRFSVQDWGSLGSPAQLSRVLVGDFNGDGKDDIAAFTRRGTWVVGLSTGSGFTTSTFAQWLPAADWAGVWVGDFNGDHRSDVVGLGINGAWVLGLSDGQHFNAQSGGSFAPGNYAVDVEVGDFAGTGTDGVATLNAAGSWTVGVFNGAGFTPAVWAHWGSTRGYDDIEVADVNGDGKADLVALGQNGRLTVGQSLGNSFLTYTGAVTGRRLPPGITLQVGDLNGDRRDDAALFLPGGTWLAALSQGKGFNLVAAGTWPLGLDQYGYGGDLAPYLPGAPFLQTESRIYLTAQAPARLQEMYFNSPRTYRNYIENFYGVVHAWVNEADLEHIRSKAALLQFFGQHEQAEFAQVRPLLHRLYPRLTDQAYRVLMAMNLAHGYYIYATTYTSGHNIEQTLHTRTGDCSEIADLELFLVRAMGIRAREVGQAYNYNSALGPITATHVVVYAGGFWLDAEVNTAFHFTFHQLGTLSPDARLGYLIDHHRVYGFYDWYFQPQVRQNQLDRGVDGGLLSFFYQYYFAGYNNGGSLVYFVRGK